MYRFVILPLSLFFLAISTISAQPILGPKADFILKAIDGSVWTLSKQKSNALVIAFIGTQCPVNNAYMPRLVEIEKEYRAKGVKFVAINSNQHDTLEDIKQHAKKFGVTFPVLLDSKHDAASVFAVKRHPHAYLLDEKKSIVYDGRIDDQYGIGYDRGKPTRRDLATAIDEVLAGKPVSVATTKVEGCFITKAPAPKKNAEITYTKEVSRILQKNCQECHRPGQIGPMPLLTYDDASNWSQMIHEVVSDNRMPPWHADPKIGRFSNDRRLSDSDRKTLLAWIDAGCPEGDRADSPATKKFSQGWSIGTPDAVFTFKDAVTVPAKSVRSSMPYKYVLLKTNFNEDKWIQAVEARPGNHTVVHHILVYMAGDLKKKTGGADGIGNGLLVAYAPGDLGATFGPGLAKKLPKGATLAFQMHYTPVATEQTDKSSIGFIFAKEPPKAEIKTRAIAQRSFSIPPGAASHAVNSRTTFDKDVILYSMFPHMHLRGKDFRYDVVYPDGKRETLLSVPRYDFGWQSNYILQKPLQLPAGTRIECTAHFDNSAKNFNNPDPSRYVFWGEQTWQEMMIGFIDYAVATDKNK